jgi:hypothetical protein
MLALAPMSHFLLLTADAAAVVHEPLLPSCHLPSTSSYYDSHRPIRHQVVLAGAGGRVVEVRWVRRLCHGRELAAAAWARPKGARAGERQCCVVGPFGLNRPFGKARLLTSSDLLTKQ